MIDNEQINPFQLNESDTIPVNINSVNLNISNNEALNEASNLALNIQNPSNEAQATTSNVNAINNDVNNFFDDQFFKHWLLDLVITINIWHIFSITAIYCYLYKISALYLIFVLIIYDVYNLLFLIKKLKNHKYLKKKKRIWFYFSENITSFILKGMSLIYYFYQPFFLIYLIIPLGINCFSRCLLYSLNKEDADCNTVLDFITIGFRLFLTIQLSTMSLKLDSIISWDWKEVFWTYWVLFSILIGINFGMFIMILSKICQSLLAEVEKHEIKGLFWFFLLTLDFTVGSCLIVISIIEAFDLADSIKLFTTIYYLLGSLIVNNLVIWMIQKDILIFLKNITAIENIELEENRVLDNKKSKKETKKEDIITIPKFLTKFSATYFKRANEQNVPKVSAGHSKKDNSKEKVKKQKFHPISSERNHGKKNLDQVLQINKLNVNEKTGKFNYQSFLEEITRNSLITSKDTTPLSIPSHPNYEMSEEKRKPFYSKTSQNKLKSETVGTKAHENCEIINFENKNTKQNETDNVLHQISKRDNINEVEEQFAPFTFKEQSEQPKQFIQTPKGYYRNVNPFMISSARLPETQKILNSFRNEQQLDPNIIDIKNSAASNKGSTTCLICFDKVPDAVFMECGHGGICYDCSLELWKSTGECYLCRNKINQVLQIDLKYKNGDYIRVLSSTQMVIEENNLEEDFF